MLSDHQSRFVQARAFTTNAHAGQPHTDAILLTITGNPHASVVDHSITSMLQPTALPTNPMLYPPCPAKLHSGACKPPACRPDLWSRVCKPSCCPTHFCLSPLTLPNPPLFTLPLALPCLSSLCTLFCSKRTSQKHNQV
jgi:hypothetical protein